MDETKTIVCQNCGAENPRSLIVTTCLRCGQSLRAPAPPAPSPPPPAPAEEPPAATAFQGPPPTATPPPATPVLPTLLPPVERAPSAELPPAIRSVPYRGEPTPPDGEPLFGSSDAGTPETALRARRKAMALLVCFVALAVTLNNAIRKHHSGGPFHPGMTAMPGGGPMGPIVPDEVREALEQPLIVAPGTPLPGRGRTVSCAIGRGKLQLSGLRYAVLPQFPASLRTFSPHPPEGPVVNLQTAARAVPPQSVPFLPTDLRLKDDHGAWLSACHAAWTGTTQGNTLAPGATLGVSMYFALGAGRSPAALGISRPGAGHPAGSPVVLTRFTAADRVPPPSARPKRPQ